MRRVLLTVALLLLLSVDGWAQSCDGCGIKYSPPTSTLTAGGSSFFAGGISLGNTVASPYANLYGDAANTLALRNGTAAQTFNIYNTYTDASDYERLSFYWASNLFYISPQRAGTGALRALVLAGVENYITGPFLPTPTDGIGLGRVANVWSNFFLSRSIQGSKTKALTESSATTVATVAVPQTAGSNFAAGEVQYTVYASDGTDTQTLNGVALFSAVNKAGTETCTIEDDQITAEAASAGTLTCTVACATGLADVVGITFDCASSLAQTSLNALVRFDMQQPNTLAFP